MHFRQGVVSDVLEALERQQGASVRERLKARLHERLAERLRRSEASSNSPSDLMPLDDAEELLLAIDSALGNGSGRVLEAAALELFSRTLSRDAGAVIVGDLFGTVARLRAPLEHPFVDAAPVFDLTSTDTGFSLTVGIAGRPRAAKILRAFASGLIRAAARFCREVTGSDLNLHGEILGDRAKLVARYRRSDTREAPQAAPQAAPPSPAPRRQRGTQPRLSLEIERILSQPSFKPSGLYSIQAEALGPSRREHLSVRPHPNREPDAEHESLETPDASADEDSALESR